MGTHCTPLRTCATCGQPLVITPSGYLACTAWHGRLQAAPIGFALRHWPDPPRARLVHVDGGERLYVLPHTAREPHAEHWRPWQDRGGDDTFLLRCYRAGGACLALDEDLRPQIFVKIPVALAVLDLWKRRRAPNERVRTKREPSDA